MIKKTVKYEDIDGNLTEDDFYFNLTRGEVIEMELTREGGLSNYFEAVIASKSTTEIVPIVRELLEKAIGRRSPDGKKFFKTQDAIDNFFGTEAWSVVLVEFLTDPNTMAQFFVGLVPVNEKANVAKSLGVEVPAPTDKEARDMSREELLASYAARNQPKTVELPEPAVVQAPVPTFNGPGPDLTTMDADELRALIAKKGLTE